MTHLRDKMNISTKQLPLMYVRDKTNTSKYDEDCNNKSQSDPFVSAMLQRFMNQLYSYKIKPSIYKNNYVNII